MVKQVLQTVYGSHIDPHRHCLKMLPVEIFWLFIELLLVTTCKVSAIPTIRPKEDFQSSLGDFSQILEAGLGHGSAKRHKTMSETGPENWQVSNLPPGNAFFPTYMPQVPFHDGLGQQARNYLQGNLYLPIRSSQDLILNLPSSHAPELNKFSYSGTSDNMAAISAQTHPGLPESSFLDYLFSESDDPRSWNEDLSESIRKLKSLIEMDSTPNEGKSGL
ncbi:hypothetical protein PCANC_23415 [Puccinia coronata f. sp. avenae]|uniref:Uncharacterized protein n=1 Tax=Puccinia coronata f. sp. avenae TaxID=200324 RepID=A0A2N5TVV1_9BASI|nr:hypothetical protein PCANC_23415 [Puccinia coronata f. sp. avenae]